MGIGPVLARHSGPPQNFYFMADTVANGRALCWLASNIEHEINAQWQKLWIEDKVFIRKHASPGPCTARFKFSNMSGDGISLC